MTSGPERRVNRWGADVPKECGHPGKSSGGRVDALIVGAETGFSQCGGTKIGQREGLLDTLGVISAYLLSEYPRPQVLRAPRI